MKFWRAADSQYLMAFLAQVFYKTGSRKGVATDDAYLPILVTFQI